MGSFRKPKVKLSPGHIFGVFKPLIFLIIPIAILVGSHFLIADRWPTAAQWINYAAYGLCGLIGLWFLWRTVVFVKEYLLLWRHDREMMRQDPLFVIENKMKQRIKEVHKKIASAGKRPYDIPFYLVIGAAGADVKSLLGGSGITFPQDLAVTKEDADVGRGDERWYVGSEAVFADVSALQEKKYEQRWKVFLKALTALRKAAPINGSLVVLSAKDLLGDEAKRGEEFQKTLRDNLQIVQDNLKEKFPVYLFVSGVDDIDGFPALFDDSFIVGRGQIMGWSHPGAVGEVFEPFQLDAGIALIGEKIRSLMLRSMAKHRGPQQVDKIYDFTSKFEELLKRTKRAVLEIFGPDHFLDPVAFRGFYFTGGPFMKLRGGAGGAAGAMTQVQDAPTVMAGNAEAETFGSSHNWFCRDLFLKKLLSESGNIFRPHRVVAKQKLIKVAAVATFAVQIALITALIVVEATDTSSWREEYASVLQKAQTLLDAPQVTAQNEQQARETVAAIVSIRQRMEKEKLFRGATSFGLDDDIADRLELTHDALFQKYFLKKLVIQAEQVISSWDPQKGNLTRFRRMLVEYTRWGNPHYEGPLSIVPFLDPQSSGVTGVDDQFLASQFKLSNPRFKPVVVDQNVVSRIIEGLQKINGATRVTLPLEQGTAGDSPAKKEWAFWQSLSDKTANLSTLSEQLLNVKAPVSGGSGRDPSDQIYDLTKVVGLISARLSEIDELEKKAQENYGGFLSSSSGFSDEMTLAAVGWQPVLKALEQYDSRNEYAYGKLILPALKKNMHWIEPLVGGAGEPLSSALDRYVEKQGDISDRDALVYKEIGTHFVAMLRALSDYLGDMESLIKKSGALVSYSTFYTGEELMRKLETVGKEVSEVTKKEQLFQLSVSKLDAIAAEIKKQEESSQGGIAPGTAKEDAANLAKAAAKGLVDNIETKKKVLSMFHWDGLSRWAVDWKGALEKEKIYLASLYWMELFDWFKPVKGGDYNKRGWRNLLQTNPFPQKNPNYFVENIEKFLAGWLESVPPELKAAMGKEDVKNSANIRDFVVLYDQVKKFQDGYLPGLRKAANDFVTAVSLLRPVAYQSWQKLLDGSEPELTWDALEAFSRFKKQYEISEGVGLRNITGSLEEVELAVAKAFKGQLRGEFETTWKKFLKEMKAASAYGKFPFRKNAPSAKRQNVMNVLASAVELGQSFSALKTQDDKAVSSDSKKILDHVVIPSRRRFLQRCAEFRDFLGQGEGAPPELNIEMVPGEIGKYYHWVRLFVGGFNHYDISVYGQKETKIDFLNNLGGVKYVGLDVNKTAMAEHSATQGELGLLQLAYRSGSPIDKQHQRWRISGQLDIADSQGQKVDFSMIFNFTRSLPELPILPE